MEKEMDEKQLQAEFERLPNDNLLAIARNHSAIGRKLAIRMLISRSSHLAAHPDIAAESKSHILNDPRILAKTDPATLSIAHKLPSLLDCFYDDVQQRKDLERVVSEHYTEVSLIDLIRVSCEQ
jgi:hypothetical protein